MQTHIHVQIYTNTHACTHSFSAGEFSTSLQMPNTMLEQGHAFWGMHSEQLTRSITGRQIGSR